MLLKFDRLTKGFLGAGKAITLLTLVRRDHLELFQVAFLALLLFAFQLAKRFHRYLANSHFRVRQNGANSNHEKRAKSSSFQIAGRGWRGQK